MKRPNPDDYRNQPYADYFDWRGYCQALEKSAISLEHKNKELIGEIDEVRNENEKLRRYLNEY